jgi:large subunit ribosomal protein L30
MAQLKIRLVKSLSGRLQKHVDTAHSMGLHTIRDEVMQPDNAQTRGKIHEIAYLIEVTEG